MLSAHLKSNTILSSKTHIHEPRNPLEMFLMLLEFLPLEFIVVYLTLIYCRREVELILMYIGQIICYFLNIHLKQKIQQPRPNPVLKGYGMPSNHAQFVSYFVAYSILWLFFRAKYLQKAYCIRITVFLFIFAIIVCSSRVYFKYHTIWQVIVGFFIGSAFSISWFFFISIIRYLKIINWVLHLKPNTYFCIKDTMNEEHQLIEKEWQKWKAKQATLNKKK